MLVFDRRNPPPPAGIATGAVNFVAVPGDVLFANEPRSIGNELFCPPSSRRLTASAPFAIAPLEGGSYQLSSFYDRRGRFWPTFKFRNLPEAGDIGGGYVDLEDARKNAGNPNYQPVYLPVDVGTPQPGTAPTRSPTSRSTRTGTSPTTSRSRSGRSSRSRARTSIRARPTPTTAQRPSDDAVTSPANPTGDPLAVPILAMTQDAKILAPPTAPTAADAHRLPEELPRAEARVGRARRRGRDRDRSDVSVRPPAPAAAAEGQRRPSRLRSRRSHRRESGRARSLAAGRVREARRRSAPARRTRSRSSCRGRPRSRVVTGKPPGPFVVIQGITLLDDSLARTIAGPVPTSPTTAALARSRHGAREARGALLRPAPRRRRRSARHPASHGSQRGRERDRATSRSSTRPRSRSCRSFARSARDACPRGATRSRSSTRRARRGRSRTRWAAARASEGSVASKSGGSACTLKPRPVLLSQGARAVLEIVDPREEDRATCDDHPVPDPCTKL